MLIEQTTEELAAAQPIQSGCTLMRVLLTKSQVTAFGDEEQFAAPLKLTFKHDATGVLDGRVLAVTANFDFKSVDSSEAAVSVFDLSCTFKLLYQLNDGCNPNQQQIDSFKKGNAVYNCWPYVREFVQNLTARMGFQPPPLPLLRVNVVNKQPPPQQTAARTEVEAESKA